MVADLSNCLLWSVPGHQPCSPSGLGRGLDEARVRGHRAVEVHRGAARRTDPSFEGQAQAD